MQKQVAHYRTLGVKQDATQEEINRAYRALAMKLHPDRPGGSREKFQLVQRAYEVLGNEFSRSNYDAELQRRKSRRLSFKRPPDLDGVLMPVYYKLSNGDLYTFETAVSQMGCTFRHGDIISVGEKMGCFVGLAGDDHYYWCREGSRFATKLCQKGSFGVGSVKLVMRANFQNYTVSQLRKFADAPLVRSKETRTLPTTARVSSTKAATPRTSVSAGSKPNIWNPKTPRVMETRSECELARLAITRKVEEARYARRVRGLIREERLARETLVEQHTAFVEEYQLEIETTLKRCGVTIKTEGS